MTFMQFWELNQHLLYGDAKAAFRQCRDVEHVALQTGAFGVVTADVPAPDYCVQFTGWEGNT